MGDRQVRISTLTMDYAEPRSPPAVLEFEKIVADREFIERRLTSSTLGGGRRGGKHRVAFKLQATALGAVKE